MPNSIKYSTSAQTLALKKGNLWIGTGDVGKGPSSSSSYYNGVTPAAGGYTIYSYNAAQTGNLSYFSAANDAALIAETNRIAGANYTTAAQCLSYFATQTDRMVCNIDYPAIVTNGLVLSLDAGFTPSYPTTGTTWYDVSAGGNNGELTNGPSYSSGNGGYISFDGVDDYASCADSSTVDLDNTVGFTVSFFNYRTSTGAYQGYVGRGDNYGFQVYGDINAADARLEIAVVSGGYNSFINYGNNFYPLNTWSFTCMKYDAQNQVVTFYQNQNKYTFTSNVGGSGFYSLSTTTPLFIGWANYAGRYFGGRLNNVMLYNKVLTDSEILQNYNATKSRFGL